MLIGLLTLALAGSPPSPEKAAPAPASSPATEEVTLPPEAPPAVEPLPPGTPIIGLAEAVATALERNFGVLNAADQVTSSRLREGVSRAQFYPKLTPTYRRSSDDSQLGLAAEQKLPWTGGSITASALMQSTASNLVTAEATPFPRTSDFRLVLTQPLLRGFGPNAAFDDLRNTRRSREGQERTYELRRQQLIVDVTRSYYQVLRDRQLLAVARQSLSRSRNLGKASTARLEVGLVSKLDVYRAELQAAQAEDSQVRAETSLESELERFRTFLGLEPSDPLQPEDIVLPEEVTEELEPLEVLTQRALENRLDLVETSDQVGDARRASSLAKQNLLPQFDLNVGVSQLGRGASFGSAWTAADRQVNVYFSTSYPLERSADAANRATSLLAVASSERSLHQKRLDVEAEVRNKVRDLQRIRKSIDLQRKGVEIAEQQRRLATLRYQRGLASNFDVVDAEGSLVVARTALVGLLSDYQVARIELMQVTGTLTPPPPSVLPLPSAALAPAAPTVAAPAGPPR